MEQCQSLIPLEITTIKSCECYTDYWKTMKELSLPYVVFDHLIEKTLSFRKYFHRRKLFYHFCINCFYKIVLSIPLDVIQHENLNGHLGCLKSHETMLRDDCCRACVNYIIDHYSTIFLTEI